LAVPIKPAASEIKGVIVAEVSLKRLWSSIADIEAGKSAQIFVVDHKGKLIAHPDYSKVLSGTDLSALPEVKEFLEAPEHDPDFGAPVTGQDGKQVMSTFARVEHPNWAVIVEESVATSLQEVNQIADFAILIFVLTLGGTFGISYYFSGRVTRQVRQLEEGAKIIADGNLDYKLAIHSGDEIENLSKQFNHMAAELSASHHGMEHKILERTRDLSTLYAAMAPLVSTDASELIRQVAERLKDATHAMPCWFECLIKRRTRISTPLISDSRQVTWKQRSRSSRTMRSGRPSGPENRLSPLTYKKIRGSRERNSWTPVLPHALSCP